MNEGVEHDIYVEQQGRKSTSLIGDQAQIFQVDGNLFYRQADVPDAEPGDLPLESIPDPGIFLPQGEILEELEQFFHQNAAKIFFLEGVAGIGKTALIAYACRCFRHAFHDIYWGVCTGQHDAKTLCRELYGFLARHAEASAAKRWNVPENPTKTDINRIVEQLERHKYLLVFDNFHQLLDRDGHFLAAADRLLFEELVRGGHQAKIMILSNRSFSFQRQPTGALNKKRLTGLDVKSTRQFLEKLGLNVSDADSRKLYNKTGGHPLALRIFAELYEQGTPLGQLFSMPFYEICGTDHELCRELFANVWGLLTPQELDVLEGMAIYRLPVPLEAIYLLFISSPAGDGARLPLPSILQVLHKNCLIDLVKNQEGRYVYTVPNIIKEFILANLTRQQFQRYHAQAADYWTSLFKQMPETAISLENLQSRQEAMYHAVQSGQYIQATQFAFDLTEDLCRCGMGALAQRVLLTVKNLSAPDCATWDTHLGHIYMVRGDYLQALWYYKRARAMQKKLGRLADVAKIDNNLGVAYTSCAEYTKALMHYTLARKVLEQFRREPELAALYNNLGYVYASRGEHVSALRYHEQARRLQAKLGLEVDLANTYNNIGWIYYMQQEYDLALNYYHRARTIREHSGIEADIAETYNNLASLYYAQQDVETALCYYQKSGEILERLHLEVNLAKNYNNLGIIYTELQNPALALKYYEHALKIQVRLGLHADAACTYNNLGFFYASSHRADDLAQAVRYYEKARAMQEKSERSAYLAIILNNLAHAYADLGEFQQAAQALNASLEIFQMFGEPMTEHDEVFLKHLQRRLAQTTNLCTKLSDMCRNILSLMKPRPPQK